MDLNSYRPRHQMQIKTPVKAIKNALKITINIRKCVDNKRFIQTD